MVQLLGDRVPVLTYVPYSRAAANVTYVKPGTMNPHKAPCHRDNKNSLADAVILETYIEAAKGKGGGGRFAFVTDNHTDFSVVGGNLKLPHPDFATAFSKIRSMYFINLAECLRKIDPSFVSEVELFALQEHPRGISELIKAHELLFDQVWYNRHKYHMWR